MRLKIISVDKPSINLSWWQIGVGATLVSAGLGGAGYYIYCKRKPHEPKKKINEIVTQCDMGQSEVLKQNCQGEIPTECNIKQNETQRSQSLKNSGNQFFKEKNFEDAIRCYSEAIELCPPSETENLATFYQNRAACYDQLGNLEQTVSDTTLALDLQPNYTKALARRAKALENLGRLEECLEDVTALCLLEQFQKRQTLDMADRILISLGQLHAAEAMKNKEPVQPSPHFVKAYFTSFPNDPIISASDFEKINIGIPQDGEVSLNHLERAKRLLVSGKYDKVVTACSEAIKLGEGLEPEALLLRATVHLLCGQLPQARNDLETIISSEVQNNKITVNALIKRASLHLQLKDKETAVKDLEEAEKVDPNNPDIYLHRGQLHLLADNFEQSLADFNKCVSLYPNFGIAVMQGHYAEYRKVVQPNISTPMNINTPNAMSSGVNKVIAKFKRDIKKFPDCVEGYILLAQILMDQEQFEEADSYFQKAIDIDPLNASLQVHRGLLQLQWKKNVEAAVKMINEAIEVDSKCCFCYETLGTIEVQRGNLTKAVEVFDKAIALAKSEVELSHTFSLRDAAVAQLAVIQRLGLQCPGV